MKNILVFLSLLPLSLFSQLELKVSLLEKEVYKFENFSKNSFEKEKSELANIFKLEITNNSEKAIYLPLDTKSYALPFSENIEDYFTEINLKNEPDLDNDFGVYAFIYQNNVFVENELVTSPYYEGRHLKKLVKLSKKREKKIKEWANLKGIDDFTLANYNRYLSHNILKIKPHEKYTYYVIINPLIKMKYWYSKRFRYLIDENKPYKIIFKIISSDRLKRLLLPSQEKLKTKLFYGVVESNPIFIENDTAPRSF